MSFYHAAITKRAWMKAWVENALSEQVREYRFKALCSAFGLSEHYLGMHLEGKVGMGPYLADEILQWCASEDVSPNNPAQFDHWLKDIDINGG